MGHSHEHDRGIRWAILGIASLVLLAGCGSGGGSDDDGGDTNVARLEGELSLPSGHEFNQVREVEPNDTAETAEDLGELDLGQNRGVAGLLDAENGDIDAFMFSVTGPMKVVLALQFTTSTSIDLDIEIYGVKDGQPPVLKAAGRTAQTSNETGSYSITVEDHEEYDFWDFVVISKSGLDNTNYILYLNPTTLDPEESQIPEFERPDSDTVTDFSDLRAMDIVDGQLIVSWPHNLPAAEQAALEARWSLTPRSRIEGHSCLYDVAWLAERESLASRSGLVWLLGHLRRDGAVRAAQPNYRYRISREPNDSLYPDQWHFASLRAPAAWEMETGSNSVIVGVIDTGVRFDHPDLQNVFTDTGYDFIDDEFTANDGDGMDDDPTDPGDGLGPVPSSFHGTHVSGIIASRSNNVQGTAGVAWECAIMPLRALGRGGGTTFDVANAALYSAGLENSSGTTLSGDQIARVVNMSLGTESDDSFFRDALERGTNQGVLFVAAAGNEAESALHYPAAYDVVMSVSATTRNLTRADYSNFGDWIDIAAPGGELDPAFEDGILSTFWDERTDTGVYAYFQGTSMASPQVCGVAALILSINPSLSNTGVRDMLLQTAQDIGSPGEDTSFGAGLVDAFAAVLAAGGTPGDPGLHLSTSKLTFDKREVDGTVVITSNDGGSLEIVNIEDFENTGGDWMSVSSDGTFTPVVVSVGVNRNGLENETYTGRINVTPLNGSEETIDVEMVVDQLDPSKVGNIVVLITNAENEEIVSQYIAGPEDEFFYRFDNIPPGSYLVFGGTDKNGNFVLGDEGELFGIYPNLAVPITIEVTEAETLSGLDFDLVELNEDIPTAERDPDLDRRVAKPDHSLIPGQ